MSKKNFKMKLLLVLMLIGLLLLASCKHSSSNKNTDNDAINSETLIGTANLSEEEKSLIQIGGMNNYYIFKIKNPKEKYKSISCWIDLFEDGKLITSLGKISTKLNGGAELKYISIALNKPIIDNTKRELIMSIISKTGVSQQCYIDENNIKLVESSIANQEQKIIEGKDIDLAAFIQNEGNVQLTNSIAENMTELLKNKRVYIFRCKVGE